MNSKILVGLVVVAALGLAYYFWQSGTGEKDSTTTPMKNQATGSIEETGTPETVSTQITGRWRSSDDTTLVREFREGGTVIDTYTGGDSLRGSWKVVDDALALPSSLPHREGSMIIQVSFPEEVVFLEVIAVSATTLELTYPGAKNTLHFTRI